MQCMADSGAQGGPPRTRPRRAYWVTGGLAIAAVAAIGAGMALPTGSSAPPPAGTPSVPAAFQGTWQGTLAYPGVPSMKFSIDLRAGAARTKVGEWLDQTRACEGDVYLRSTSRFLLLHLVTTADVADKCEPQADALASLDDRTLLSFGFTDSYGATPASGTLRRTG
jgi:hypothetical protein